MPRRNLTEKEIDILAANGCWADNWDLVTVADGFEPNRVRCVGFGGHVSLGNMGGMLDVDGLGPMAPALCRTTLCEVSLGDDFYISDVALLSGYDISDRFIAVDCGRIFAPADGSSFGIGTRVSVVNEGGGREVALSAGLNSNVAYMVAMHGYRSGLTAAYEALVEKEKTAAAAQRGTMGKDVHLYGVRLIDHVRIGNKTTVCGASQLVCGTILSTHKQPVFVGADVRARNFVFDFGANVHTGAGLTDVFVGQCAEVGQGFMAENMLAFANCQLLCGEGVALLAGPYTVSHHKTSLLIAGAYSFYNAGSATNSSNHHYRLGPVHQAVYDRGCKTGSGSYVLQPAHIGAYSMVVGHHKSNPDTSAFPFSILAEREGESHLLVAQNLKTIGLFRDSQKWKSRDKRVVKADAISFDVLNPITVGQMMSAVRRMEGEMTETKGEMIIMGGVRIRKALLGRAAKAYRTAIDSFLAKAYLHADGRSDVLDDDWVDCGGLVMPASELNRIEQRLVAGGYDSVEALAADFRSVEERSKELVLRWAAGQAARWYGYTGTKEDTLDAAQRVAEAVRDIKDNMVADAAKEWNLKLRTGYGLDGTDDDQYADFVRIHGTVEENKDVAACQRYFDETW